MTRTRRLVPAAALLSLAPLIGCVTPGERAGSGQCPEGEVCSDETPGGLLFAGAPLGGDWQGDQSVKVTAAGGTQSIEVLRNDEDQTPLYSFDAEVEGDGWSIAGRTPPRVTVEAAPAGGGDGLLRILDSQGLLEDQVRVPSLPARQIQIEPDTGDLMTDTSGPWALHTGTRGVFVDLEAADGTLLADDSARFRATGGDSGHLVSWNRLELSRDAAGEVPLELVTGAGQTFTTSVTFADHIDAIDTDELSQMAANQNAVVCVRGMSGAMPVYGVDWSVQVSGELLDVTPLWGSNDCLVVASGEPGTGTLIVSADDVTLSIDVQVGDGGSAGTAARTAAPDDDAVPPVQRLPAPAPSAGERARAAAAAMAPGTAAVRATTLGGPAATMAR